MEDSAALIVRTPGLPTAAGMYGRIAKKMAGQQRRGAAESSRGRSPRSAERPTFDPVITSSATTRRAARIAEIMCGSTSEKYR